MKKITLSILFSFLIFLSCSDDDGDAIYNGSNSNLVNFTFENEESLSLWESENGSISIDYENFVSGSASAKIHGTSGCSMFELEEGVIVGANKNYKISFYYKNSDVGIGCVSSFLIRVKQGVNYILEEYDSKDLDWKKETFYFHTDDTRLPITLGLYFGTADAWVDDLIIEEIE